MLLASLLIGVYITFFEDNEASVWVRLVSFLLVYPLMIMVSYLMFECVVLMFRFWSWTGKWFRNRLYEDLLRAAQVRYVDEEDV
jgi:hypothetical protein